MCSIKLHANIGIDGDGAVDLYAEDLFEWDFCY